MCYQEGNVRPLFSAPSCSQPCRADHSSELAALLWVTDPLSPCPVAETRVTTYEGQGNVLSLSQGPAQSWSTSSPPLCFLPAQATQRQAPVSREGAVGVASSQLFRWKRHLEKPSRCCGLTPAISTAFRLPPHWARAPQPQGGLSERCARQPRTACMAAFVQNLTSCQGALHQHHAVLGATVVVTPSVQSGARGEPRGLSVVWELEGNVGNISCSPGVGSHSACTRLSQEAQG